MPARCTHPGGNEPGGQLATGRTGRTQCEPSPPVKGAGYLDGEGVAVVGVTDRPLLPSECRQLVKAATALALGGE